MMRFACVPGGILARVRPYPQQSCPICAPSEPRLCAVAHYSSIERCIGSRCRSRARCGSVGERSAANERPPVGMRAVPARASQATFEERWTLGRGLQVRSARAVFGLRARARAFGRFGRWATVLSACALLAQLENILREYPIELQCVQLRPKPHSLRWPFKRPRRSPVARHWPVRGPLTAKPNCR